VIIRLNLNLKESAPILGISPTSVKTARYRLRKKLGLSTEENLVDFLIQIDQKGGELNSINRATNIFVEYFINMRHTASTLVQSSRLVLRFWNKGSIQASS